LARSDTNPQLIRGYTPLQTLAEQALRRFGDFAPGTSDGQVLLMFIEFANEIIDEVRMHPYHDGRSLPYYESLSDRRGVDDQIIIAGLLLKYAEQQTSDKVQIYGPKYYQTLNRQLWAIINGNTKIEVNPTDGASNKRYTVPRSAINGLPLPTAGD